MKHAVVVVVLLCLSACINVDDFGPYWNRASVDRKLLGDWKLVPASPDQTRSKGYGIGDVLRIAIKGDAYELTSFDHVGKQRAAPQTARTLAVGTYRFLASGPNRAIMAPYRLDGRTLYICQQFGPAMVDFIEAHYPNAVNIGKNRGEGRYIVIKRFDDEVFEVLASVPDTDSYWDCDRKFEGVR